VKAWLTSQNGLQQEKYTISGVTAAAIATAAIALLEIAYRTTRLGIAVDSIGTSKLAAETYGISAGKVYILVASLAGAAAGLGGALYALSVNMPLTSIPKGGLGFGYIGILGAWLASLSVAGCAAAGLLLALLYNMTTTLQLWGIRASMIYAFESILVLSVLFTLSLSRYRLVIEHD
jgi:simple sugar transport system permease protein